MDPRRPAVWLSLLLAGACAGLTGPGPRGALEFRAPEGGTAGYTLGDTMRISVDAGMGGTIDMRLTTAGRLAMDFEEDGDGVTVTTRFEEFSGRMSNPMAGATTASQDDIEGELVFRVDRRGRVEVIERPRVSTAAAQLARTLTLPYEMFPALPGRAVSAGESWADTVRVLGEEAGVSTDATYVMTYTLVGDTALDGATVHRIDFAGTVAAENEGVAGEFRVAQSVTGDIDGTAFWDSGRSVMVSSQSRSSLSGSVNVPAAGVPPMYLTILGTSKWALVRP